MAYPSGYPFGYGGSALLDWLTDDDGTPIPVAPGYLDTYTLAVRRLWKQYEDRPNWLLTAKTIGLVFRDLNSQQRDIMARRYLSTAFGDTLDEIGALVKRPRGSLAADADYAKAIAVDASTLFGSGTRPQIVSLARALFPASPFIRLVDRYPAGFVLTIVGISGGDLDLLIDIASDVPAAGVGSWISTYATGNAGGGQSISGIQDSSKLAKGDSISGGATDILAGGVHGRLISG